MSLLEKITLGKRPAPPRILIYGTEGIGKSTFASHAPKPIFIPTEDGLGEINCASFPMAKSFRDVISALSVLTTEKHDYETVVIDSLDYLESLIWDDVCRDQSKTNIEEVGGGFGKGYVAALSWWWRILTLLDDLHSQSKMVVILIAHSKVERFEDPEKPAYDRYSPRLNKHAVAMITSWADAVFFATYEFRTEKQKLGFGKERSFAVGYGASGKRMMRTVGGPSCVAKNRYGLSYEISLSWNTFMSEMNSNKTTTPNQGE
jgi:hypothetical protein